MPEEYCTAAAVALGSTLDELAHRIRTALQISRQARCNASHRDALPPAAPYSEAHYKVVTANTDLASLASYDTLFVDSLSAGSRLSFTWAEQQPEAFSDRGRKDLRAIYGLYALHYERSGPVWLLTLCGTVPADVAAIVIAHPNIAGVGDCLFANGPSQTWRWAE